METARSILQHQELEGETFFWPAGPTGVLLFHGLTATTAEVRPLARFLFEHGYTVAGRLLPGHGTTPEDLNQKRWQDWADAAEDAYQGMLLKCNQVIVGGESMGGLLALSLASGHAETPGILLYAPALSIPGIGRARFLAPFMQSIRKGSTDDSMPWQGYYVNPVRAVAQLYLLQREILKRLPSIRQPVLILQGKLDRTIDPQSSQIVFDKIGSTRKELVWLDRSSHVLLLDRQFDEASQRTLDFIKTIVKD